jgi:cytochrome c-type biogenesis protein CcmF
VALVAGIIAFFLAPQGAWKVAAGVFGAVWVGLGTLRFLWTRFKGTGTRLTAEMLGMTLAHLGVAVFLVGALLVEGLEQQHEVAVKPGQTVELGDYSFRFDGVAMRQGPNYQASYGTVHVFADGKPLTVLHPEKRAYLSGGQVMTEAAIVSGVTRDLYVAIGESLGGDAWALRVQIKPFVRWVWAGAILMMLGGLVTATDKRFRRMPASPSKPETAR